jgi:hypothetical protein
LRVDLRQRLGGAGRLRRPQHDRPDAIDHNAVPGPRSALRKSGLPAGRHDLPAWPRRLSISRSCACQGHYDLADGGNSHSGREHHHRSGLDTGYRWACRGERGDAATIPVRHIMPSGNRTVCVGRHS